MLQKVDVIMEHINVLFLRKTKVISRKAANTISDIKSLCEWSKIFRLSSSDKIFEENFLLESILCVS